MLITSHAIVLRCIRHGERSLVLTAHTELHGLRSFLVRPSRKGGMVSTLFHPLARLELVWDERTDHDLPYLKEARNERPFERALQDPVGGALILFMQEVLLRTLRGEAGDREMHDYLQEALQALDAGEDQAVFPILFLLGLARCLGFLPEAPEQEGMNFDLLEGRFIAGEAPSGHTLRPPLSTALAGLLAVEPGQGAAVQLQVGVRRALLDHVLFYFRVHIDGLRELRSPEILHQVLGR